VILESTTSQGTTDEEIRPILEAGGCRQRKGFWLVFSPELIDPGNQCFGPKNTPNVIFIATTPVTGTGQRSAELAMSLARPTGLER
jgi:UDP-N-acetyl-D-mannosaminuronate dehydrogenase